MTQPIEVGPFVRYLPGESNLVLTMPHSGMPVNLNRVRHHLMLGDLEVVKTVNTGVDLCVPDVTRGLEYRSAARIWTMLPRVALDVNRLVEHADPLAV